MSLANARPAGKLVHLLSSLGKVPGKTECGRYLDDDKVVRSRTELPEGKRLCHWCDVTRASREPKELVGPVEVPDAG